ncbi:MAG: response regulator [Acidobacteria bacterium]|nr:response regulator [Acidobacteriota bacterium]
MSHSAQTHFPDEQSHELKILLLEDSASDAELVLHELRKAKITFTSHRVDTESDFLQALRSFAPDLILADYSLPGFDGMSALALASQLVPDSPFIFVSGTLGEELAIETLKSGATDYVLKQRLARLAPSVHRALREAQERVERKRAERELEESFEQLRALTARLQSIREEERARIAREIHDELGQSLTGLKFDLSWLENRLKSNEPDANRICQEKVHAMFELINSTIRLGRKIATELRPGILDDLGLVDALEWQAQEFQERTGISCTFISLPEGLQLDDYRTTALFRIFQETLTNIARHAQATQVRIRLQINPSEIVFEIQDNGRGITKEELFATKSLGLLGIRERVLGFGGKVLFSGQPGQGTTVSVYVPYSGALSRSTV